MKTQRPRTRLVFVAALAALYASAHADNQLSETVVTATRTAQTLGELVSDVSVIDRTEIDRSGAASVADLLDRLPGVEMVRNGGPGATTSIFLRGAETRYTAVFLDGVRIDSLTTGGANWEAIPLAQVDRIEVLRGPASAVYGSDAIGGVVQIFTRKGEGAFRPYASVGVGTYSSARLQSGFSGSQGQFDYSLNASRDLSEGFETRTTPVTGTVDHGYQQTASSGRVGWQLTSDQRIEVSSLNSDSVTRYYNQYGTSDDNRNLERLSTNAINWQARWTDAYRSKVSVTDSNTHYEILPTASYYMTETRLRGYLWQNEWRFGRQLLTAALERREDVLENSSMKPVTSQRTQDGVSLGYGYVGDVHTWQLQARQDQNSDFGRQATGSVGYGYAPSRDWRLTASVGNAFRAPTMYQQYSVYGVPTLKPETANNAELGARMTHGSSVWSLVAYENLVDNQITFSSAGPCASSVGCYANTAQARYIGATLSGQEIVSDVRLRGSIDVQDPRDAQTGKLLARRAQRYMNLGADTRVGRWAVGADARFAGDRYDDAANTVILPGYSVYNFYAQTALGRDWSVLFKLDNATNSGYQLANGYATTGRSLFAILKWEPQAFNLP